MWDSNITLVEKDERTEAYEQKEAACGIMLLHLVADAACQAEALTLLGSGLKKHRRASRETWQKINKNNHESKNHSLQKTETFWLFGLKKVLSWQFANMLLQRGKRIISFPDYVKQEP